MPSGEFHPSGANPAAGDLTWTGAALRESARGAIMSPPAAPAGAAAGGVPRADQLVAYARTVKVGDGSEQGTQIGPINNEAQYRRVLDLIQDAKDKGYRFLVGGDAADVPGYFVPITIIDNPPEDSRIVQEEQFGPILPLLKFDDVDDVVARANATDYGLGGSVWGQDEDKAFAIAQRIASGTVWVNETQHLSPTAAFGGMKQSGVGIEGGLEGLLEYTNAQTIVRRKVVVPAS